MAYASNQKFSGQAATAGRMVIVAVEAPDGVWVRAGVILGVSSQTDKVYIRDLGADGPVDYDRKWTFVDVKTPAETKYMKPGEWAWPPRV